MRGNASGTYVQDATGDAREARKRRIWGANTPPGPMRAAQAPTGMGCQPMGGFHRGAGSSRHPQPCQEHAPSTCSRPGCESRARLPRCLTSETIFG